MASPKASTKYKMLPYRKGGPIDYASLEFDADETEVPPDHMEQNLQIHEVMGHLFAHFTDFHRRPDVFIDTDTNICYDPNNLNVRIAPDVYLAFGVDSEAIRSRQIYLPWEVGKVPDWALEIASESTRLVDINRKPPIYAQNWRPRTLAFRPNRRQILRLLAERPPSGGRRVPASRTDHGTRRHPQGIQRDFGTEPRLGRRLAPFL